MGIDSISTCDKTIIIQSINGILPWLLRPLTSLEDELVSPERNGT